MFNMLKKEFPTRLMEACELFGIGCSEVRINNQEVRFEVMEGKNFRGYVKIPAISAKAEASKVELALQGLSVYFPAPMTKVNKSGIKDLRERIELLRWEVRRIVSEIYYQSGKEEVKDESEEFSASMWNINSFHENQLFWQSPQSNGGLIHQSRFENTKEGIKGKKATSLGMNWR